MNQLLRRAMTEAESLPAESQDEIGRAVLRHVAALKELRAEIDSGIAALDRGEGGTINPVKFLNSIRDEKMGG